MSKSNRGESKLTPMMQRYMEVKEETPGTVLLFRMGDFFELFFDDAKIASKVLGVTLTSRDKNSDNPVPMAGFPHHALEGYLQKLIRAGHKVAVCDQVEDPKTAKGLVRREVTRIVTPGTLTDEALLDPHANNYIVALAPTKQGLGIAWLELSAGRFQCLSLPLESHMTAQQPLRGHATHEVGLRARLLDELARIQPTECLVPEGTNNDAIQYAMTHLSDIVWTERPAWSFQIQTGHDLLLKHFGTNTLSGFDVDDDSPAVAAAGVVLEYAQDTQRTALQHVSKIEPFRRGSSMLIDETTRRSLELTRTQRTGQREGSLLHVIDETVTPMGARLLGDWLSNPLTEPAGIERRLDAVEELAADSMVRQEVRDQLSDAYDLQRLATRVATQRATPRDMRAMSQTLALLPKIKAKLSGRKSDLMNTLERRIDLCPELRESIETTLVDEPPVVSSEGGIFRAGVNAQLDELRDLARGGKKWIAEYQAREIERTGIPSMKVGFNKVFGYYLEVTAAHRDKVPEEYVRKQTLKNQERFITPELKEYEDKVLRAEERAIALETEMFNELKQKASEECLRLQLTAEVLANIDVLAGLATLAGNQNYCRPKISSEPVLNISEGRHPVLDKLQPSGAFVPNDVQLGCNEDGTTEDASFIALITGPNMAGKSTYIRQAALITILAQIGSFVPASSARIGIVDRVFARVGASDELGRGQSTFMVEMTETARILNTATRQSLVILDEIGRGTSTYDGISLAWAITEHLHDEVKCRTLFATHYHELTELPKTLKHVSNWNVSVHEQDGDVVFLHKIVPGSADRSYGIHVARLAGIPLDVVGRADVILNQLEQDHQNANGKTTVPARQRRSRQPSLFPEPTHPLVDQIRTMNIDEMTPLHALQELARMKGALK
ncbi:MAG: DNA mismatch repair protein MutS [Planctomycetaceae bacterium]|nr:DNA mismatch repair protein MutS [Planctomycetaceae bacterium]